MESLRWHGRPPESHITSPNIEGIPMKTAHDLVADAKSCTQEIALKDAE